MRQRPYSLRSRPFRLLLSLLLPFLILWQFQRVLPTAARDASQLQANRACMRFSLDQGQQSNTGAGVNGRYELQEVHTGHILATWQAAGSDTNSGWLYDIQNSYPRGSWVEVYFYPAGQERAVSLEILNPAPHTAHGWIAPGQCHAVELQFPPAWRSQTQTPLPPGASEDDPVVDNPPAPVDAASPFSGLPDWQSRQSTEGFFGKYLAWGDMDGDGDLDLAESFSETNRDFGRLTGISGIRVYINENGVMARDPIWVEIGEFLSLTSIAWGDMDGDGDLDLAASALGNPNRVYINQNGTINRNGVMLLGNNELSTHLAWGDANGDGLLDLAVANREGANQLYINQDGTLTDSQVITFGGNLDASRLAWADYDRDSDGLLDLAVANRNGPNQLFINQAGTLSDDAVILLDGSQETVDLAWGDVDGDGYLDLAAANNNGPDQLYLNDHGERLTPDDTWQVSTSSTTGLAWEDVNNDGRIDLTVLTAGGGTVYLNQNGRLQADADGPLTIELDGTFLAWADVDGDGDRDLATANEATNNLFYNQGISLQTQGKPIATGAVNNTDVNGDGVFSLRDIDNSYIGDVTFMGQDGTLKRYSQSTLNLTLSPPRESTTLDVLAWGDVDGDGDLDLAVGERYGISSIDFGGRIVIYENDRGILTRLPIAATPEIIPRALAWADVDGDGDLDLAVANNRQNAVYFNHGNGLTRTDVWYSADGEATTSVAWGDMDGDGDLDLAAGNNGGPNVVYLNEGGALIRLPVWESRETDATTSVAWGDVDGDGDLDLAVGNEGANKLYLNQEGMLASLATWESQEDSATAHVTWGDVDGDGDLDLAADNLVYFNNRNGRNQLANSYPTVTVKRPVVPDLTNFSVPSQILSETVIAIPFTLFDGENDTVAYVAGQYSLNGGGEWFTAVATDTNTTNLVADGRTYTFKWDTFASGFFGQADNVVFRLLAYTQPPASQSAISGIYRYPNSLPLNLQTPYVSATTLPFRLRGTQVQVIGVGQSPENGMLDAVVYRRPKNGLTAQLMRWPNLQQPLLTDQEGFLGGRGALNIGDQLMALVPISQSFRIPPQLLLDGSSTAEVNALTQPPTTMFTTDLWFLPTGSRGTLLALGNDFSLSYENFASSSTVSVTLKEETFTATMPSFLDGYPHHLAFSWDGQQRENNGVLYLDGSAVSTATLAPGATLTSQSLTIGKAHVGSLDEIRLWRTVRTAAQISDTLDITTGPFATSDHTLLNGLPEAQPDLVGYWPVGDKDAEALADLSGNQNDATLNGQASVAFKPLYSLYHTSAAISDTVQFSPVRKPGVQTLTVSEENPLLLFNLDVSLEWDGRNDTLFLQQLEDSFRRASALLYDVTNGQVALGQINLYHSKAYWGVADIVIFADNSLRPSAAIGGVVNSPTNDPDIADGLYLPGQIRMGTSWDPYGENIADLGEDWTRALAHELAHYLLFLPDNYLGLENGIFQRVVCPDSFMTTTSDPSFSEFLTQEEWLEPERDGCQNTLAQITTGRADWDTILKFFPMLHVPENPPIPGPPDLPLDVTFLVPWAFADETLPFPERNFDLRNQNQERLRLPTAQAYLIKTQTTTTPNPDDPDDLSHLEDDMVIALGSPTGGGDRLSVRGAEPDDRLCIFDTQGNLDYSGCIEAISSDTVSVVAKPLHPDYPAWQPSIIAYASSPTAVSVTVSQALLPSERLNVQLYPMHYGSVDGNAPAVPMNRDGRTHTQTLSTLLPAYEYAVRVWVEDNGRCPQTTSRTAEFSCIREAITILRLNPENWDPTPPAGTTTGSSEPPELLYTPFTAGPDRTVIGGPDRTVIGGPDRTVIGGPDRTVIGGSVFLGNPDRTVIGGPDRTVIGGVERIMLGSANATIVGGAQFMGNPDRTVIGGGTEVGTGTASRSLNAPILSADAQVVIYSQQGFFADNGVASLQALATVPEQAAHPWLVPVGQAYRVVLSEQASARYISFTYLQREVPEGYEHTLKIYFLPDMQERWELITDTVGLVENLIVGSLRNENGTYAIMATIDDLPMLTSDWNLLAYPLPDIRCVSTDCDPDDKLTNSELTAEQSAELNLYRSQCSDQALASLGGRVDGLRPSAGTTQIPDGSPDEMENPIAVERLMPGSVYWIHLTDGPALTPQFAPPRRLPDGTLPNCTELHDFIEALPATPP